MKGAEKDGTLPNGGSTMTRPATARNLPPPHSPPTERSAECTIKVKVALPTGINLRASSVIAETASDFACRISMRNSDSVVDAKGILSVMSLGADTGTPLEITAKGPGANRSLDILAGLTTLEGQSFFSLVDRG